MHQHVPEYTNCTIQHQWNEEVDMKFDSVLLQKISERKYFSDYNSRHSKILGVGEVQKILEYNGKHEMGLETLNVRSKRYRASEDLDLHNTQISLNAVIIIAVCNLVFEVDMSVMLQ